MARRSEARAAALSSTIKKRNGTSTELVYRDKTGLEPHRQELRADCSARVDEPVLRGLLAALPRSRPCGLEQPVSTHLAILEPTSPKAGVSVDSSAANSNSSAGGAPSGPSLLMSFAPLLILIPFLWLSSRRTKKEAEDRGKLAKGDKVVVQGGILGEVVEKTDKTARVKIAQGVVVECLLASISPVGAPSADGAK